MTVLDLDARRAERGDGHQVTLAGQTWTLPARLPLIVGQYLSAGDVEGAVESLFGKDAVSTIAPILDDDDLEQITKELYGLDSDAGDKANGNRAQRRAKK